ncbi:hypothetical protein VAWG006_29450 [Aeromonas enteropelogenes]|nr:hypothetical protein VAWG006_29450 [Aeromonas enteropelogenes]BEE22854.1 hypothetical protein VAWG007_29490 [Aeromonas enteropelogenes]
MTLISTKRTTASAKDGAPDKPSQGTKMDTPNKEAQRQKKAHRHSGQRGRNGVRVTSRNPTGLRHGKKKGRKG